MEQYYKIDIFIIWIKRLITMPKLLSIYSYNIYKIIYMYYHSNGIFNGHNFSLEECGVNLFIGSGTLISTEDEILV